MIAPSPKKQATIASLHAEEPRDWRQIAALYGELARRTGSAVVELNQAVAVAESGEVEAGLAIADRLERAALAHIERYRDNGLRSIFVFVNELATNPPPLAQACA